MKNKAADPYGFPNFMGIKLAHDLIRVASAGASGKKLGTTDKLVLVLIYGCLVRNRDLENEWHVDERVTIRSLSRTFGISSSAVGRSFQRLLYLRALEGGPGGYSVPADIEGRFQISLMNKPQPDPEDEFRPANRMEEEAEQRQQRALEEFRRKRLEKEAG